MKKSYEELKNSATTVWNNLQNSSKPRISVGLGTCGAAAGANDVVDAIKKKLAELKIDAVITRVGCIGLCCIEPIISIGKPGKPDVYYGDLTPEKAAQLIEDFLTKDNPHPEMAAGKLGEGDVAGIPSLWDHPMLKGQVRIVLRNSGLIDPENIDHYIARGGYAGAVRALKMKPEEIIQKNEAESKSGQTGIVSIELLVKRNINK